MKISGQAYQGETMQTDNVVIAAVEAALELAKLSIGRDNNSRSAESLAGHFKIHYKEVVDAIKANPINSGGQPQ